MTDVTIYGASDDLVEVEGDVAFLPTGYDGEVSADDVEMALKGPDGQLRIRVRYGANGCWGVEVAPLDDGVKMLPVEMGQQTYHDGSTGYSAMATVRGVATVLYTLIGGDQVEE